jgi:hypothetical protein
LGKLNLKRKVASCLPPGTIRRYSKLKSEFYEQKKLKQHRLWLKNNDVEKSSLPDFLIIGAQKSATTFIYHQLNQLPDFFLPTIDSTSDPSEVRFFDERFRNSIDWYSSLYKGKQGKIKGDKTPKYYLMPLNKIRFIQELLPEVKILFILRNPIERAWSDAVMNLERFNGITFETNKDLYYNLLKARMVRGLYSKHIDRWRSVVSEDRFYIGIYDTLKADPEKFLVEIITFLGGDPTGLGALNLSKRVNKNPETPMPVEVNKYLKDSYHSEIIKLKKSYQLPVSSWLDTR